MGIYPRTSLPSVLSVKSIITVWHFYLQHQFSAEDIHDHPEILYVDEGTHTLLVGGNEISLNAGQMIIYGPNTAHSGPVPSDATIDIVSFEVESTILEPFYNQIITLNSQQRGMLSQIITEGTYLFDRLRHKYGFIDLPMDSDIAPYELQKLKNNLELFLLDICNSQGSAQQIPGATNLENSKFALFEKLQQYLKANLHLQLTLEIMAQEIGVSPSTLTKLCHEHCGCSPIAYFISLKIDAAKKMICNTGMNFTQIAESLGYNSLHYFSKQFKKETGKTPSVFARSVLKK